MKTVCPDFRKLHLQGLFPSSPTTRWKYNETGSSHSRVGPPVTIIFLSFKDTFSSPKMFSCSARRPAPSSPQATLPSSGSMSELPMFQAINVSLGRRVRPHVRVHGRCNHYLALDRKGKWCFSRSSAMPFANLAIMFAVAGATRKSEASFLSSMCPISLASLASRSKPGSRKAFQELRA